MAQIIQKSYNSLKVEKGLKRHSYKRLLLLSLLVLIGVVGYQYIPSKKVLSQGPNGKVVYIQVTKDGFLPASMVVESGTTVVWENNTEDTVSVSSVSPLGHEGHSFLPGFNGAELGPSDQYGFTFELEGDFSFSDANVGHLEQEQHVGHGSSAKYTGQILVKPAP